MSQTSVSIVMTYYERAAQLKNTLKSFAVHGYGPDIEVIVVDDGSVMEKATPADFSHEFQLKIVYISPEEKWYSNPCIPFNIGFAAARGEIVLIQNAECLHKDNIVSHARAHITETNYLSYACYSISETKTDTLSKAQICAASLASIVTVDQTPSGDGCDGWYNHSLYNPLGFHFCSAIRKNNLLRLNGFDKRYARGISFDDNELLERIRRLPLDVKIVDEAVVIHQYHYSNMSPNKRRYALIDRNRDLYKYYTKRGGGLLNYCYFFIQFLIAQPLKKIFYAIAIRVKRVLLG